jgi:hypothetical protein
LTIDQPGYRVHPTAVISLMMAVHLGHRLESPQATDAVFHLHPTPGELPVVRGYPEM